MLVVLVGVPAPHGCHPLTILFRVHKVAPGRFQPGQPLRFREYIVYERDQAYPEFQVTFERMD